MRDNTTHIHQEQVNQAINYISAHLHKPLALERVAEHLCVSQSHLLRVMRIVLQEPLASYISRQRMERAVMYMQTEELTLEALAAKVGYDNAQSFSKTFKKQFGQSPKAYLNTLEERIAYAVSRQSSETSSIPLSIVEEDELKLVYVRAIGEYGDAKLYNETWRKLSNFLREYDSLSSNTRRIIGISFDDPNITKPHQLRFYACATVHKDITPTGEFGCLTILKGRYAVYTLKGSYSQLQNLYNRICTDFPYKMRHGLTFEEYLNSPHDTAEEDLLTKIYIPIK